MLLRICFSDINVPIPVFMESYFDICNIITIYTVLFSFYYVIACAFKHPVHDAEAKA